MARIAGVEVPPPEPELGEKERIDNLVEVFEEAGLTVLMPTAISPDISLLEGSVRYVSEEDWVNVQPVLNEFLELCDALDVSRVFMWTDDGKVNIGIMVRVEDVLYLRYIIVELT